MHLSLLSDAVFSDLFDDAGRPTQPKRAAAARQHLDGLLRGLAFVAVLLTPFALTFAPAAFGHPRDAVTQTAFRP